MDKELYIYELQKLIDETDRLLREIKKEKEKQGKAEIVKEFEDKFLANDFQCGFGKTWYENSGIEEWLIKKINK